ncbi:hypothetical protein WICPIJ_005416 [Wickerhamomyces pijperi]|uniref:Major facilitator superfamily (MFS) profile domain-containing protein n=1 Tax=Wickerhamomyces pijperi TaxID=599730 RepID=A0A9P8Q6A1_WICPI|nr:hypothetical protein WICPIJ_005416 [Wickerhamomyces pijperi]
MTLTPVKYTAVNLFAFLFHTATTISLVVFLTSTQSFLLTTQLHTKPSHLGKTTATLTSLDEITCMMLSPFVGALLDYFSSNNYGFNTGPINGFSRLFGVIGVTIMSLVIYGYTFVHTLLPYLMIMRILFAVGVSCAVGMFGVMLSEIVDSEFEFCQLNPFAQLSGPDIEQQRPLMNGDIVTLDENNGSKRSRGKFSALLGISSGIGAVFAVMNYLPLADKLQTKLGLTPEDSIIYSYRIVGVIGLVSALILNFTLYRHPSNINNSNSVKPQYLTLLQEGIKTAVSTPNVLLAYFGSFLARSTSILNTVFIPLYTHTSFIQNGQCIVDPHQPFLKESCHQAYVQAMILTGISNTVTLITAPIYGIVIDRYGSYLALIGSFISGLMSCLLFFASSKTLSFLTIFGSVLLGLSQIGFIITSMALLTSSSDQSRKNIGAMAGVYSLFGGLGILILSGLGGVFIDWFESGKAVFGIMSGLFGMLGICCWYTMNRGLKELVPSTTD